MLCLYRSCIVVFVSTKCEVDIKIYKVIQLGVIYVNVHFNLFRNKCTKSKKSSSLLPCNFEKNKDDLVAESDTATLTDTLSRVFKQC